MNYVPKQALDLIKESEGLSLTTYKDPAGVLTIGYGHTGADVIIGRKITIEQAEQLLAFDAAESARQLDSFLKGIVLSDNKRAALISFIYNLGVGNFKTSTLASLIIKKASDVEVAAEFMKWKWSKAAGKMLPGLLIRRAKETILYLTK